MKDIEEFLFKKQVQLHLSLTMGMNFMVLNLIVRRTKVRVDSLTTDNTRGIVLLK